MNLWERFQSWFVANARQLTYVSIADPEAETSLQPNESYFGLWLVHGFLKRDVEWLHRRYPAVHVSVRLDVAGEVRTLTRLARPAEGMVGPGVWTNFPVTGLVPYRGGTVELEAGLSAIERTAMLGAAVEMLGDFSGLVTPPLSEALHIADKVAGGVQKLLDAGDGDIDLGLHQAFVAPGGGGENQLAPGYLAVVGAPAGELDPTLLRVEQDRLHLADGDGSSPLEGYDYLLFRIEARRERDDWRFERFETLIRKAKEAHFNREPKAYERHRDDAFAAALNSPDLTDHDRERVALAIKDELEQATAFSNAFEGAPTRSLNEIMDIHAVPAEDSRLTGELTVRDLID